MTRRDLLRLLPLTAAACATSAPEPAARRPNFVFVLADDLGWTDLSAYGSRFYETPNVDRLMGQGMKFTQAYAACPVCSPTRASIVTGRYPARVGITNFIPGDHRLPYSKVLPPRDLDALPHDEFTIAEALAMGGYTSAAIGKWHLGYEGSEAADHGFQVGYAVSRGPNAAQSRYFNPGWVGQGETPGAEGDYLPDHLTDRALEFLEANRQGPFLLYLAFHVPHIPIEGKAEHVEKFRPKVKPGAVPAKDQHNPTYAAMIWSMDENIGRVLAKLDELDLADNTVVFFFSDNGGLTAPEYRNEPATSNLPLREGKGHVYEGGIREPLIVRWPGVVAAGSVSDEQVVSTDFLPTMLELAGVETAGAPPVDGMSFARVLRGEGRLAPRRIFWHYPHYSNQLGRPAGAVRDGDWKLIEFYDDDSIELYNLDEDIGETRDRAADEPERAAELREALRAWRREVGAQEVTPNPRYDPKRAELRESAAARR